MNQPNAVQPQHKDIPSPSSYDKRTNQEWMISFAATMIPFCGFCYGHQRGVTVRVLESLAKRRYGVYGIFGLPFVTLGMEKSIYDTVQSLQGINPNDRPADRGGFPSGGANLPSFSLVPVQEKNVFAPLLSWGSKQE